MNDLAENLMLINAVLSLYLALLSVHPVRRREMGAGTLWLAALLATFGLVFLDWWLYLSDAIEAVPFFVGFLWILPLLLGPLFYCFALWLLGAGSAKRFSNRWFWVRHGLPLVAFIVITLPFLLLPSELRLMAVRSSPADGAQPWVIFFRLTSYAVSLLFYSGLSVWRTGQAQLDSSFRENVLVVRWAALMFFIVSLVLMASAVFWSGAQPVVLICLMFLLLSSLAAFARLQPAIREVQHAKYRNSEVPETVVQTISNNIRRAMTEEHWFLEENTSLGALAQKFDVSAHQMSQIVNRGFRQSYADFINDYRVRHAAELLLRDPNEPIVDIAATCGFGSKSSFYNAFRKKMACSPSEFRQRQRSQQ